jgi:hypothetical protein
MGRGVSAQGQARQLDISGHFCSRDGVSGLGTRLIAEAAGLGLTFGHSGIFLLGRGRPCEWSERGVSERGGG